MNEGEGVKVAEGKQLDFQRSAVGGWVTKAYLSGTVVGVEDETVVQGWQMKDRRIRSAKTRNATYLKDAGRKRIREMFYCVNCDLSACETVNNSSFRRNMSSLTA